MMVVVAHGLIENAYPIGVDRGAADERAQGPPKGITMFLRGADQSASMNSGFGEWDHKAALGAG